MKNGHGRFFHLDHGQLFEGFWVDDVAKCGTMIDFGRDEAPEPTQFPIPKVSKVRGQKQQLQSHCAGTRDELLFYWGFVCFGLVFFFVFVLEIGFPL